MPKDQRYQTQYRILWKRCILRQLLCKKYAKMRDILVKKKIKEIVLNTTGLKSSTDCGERELLFKFNDINNSSRGR